MNKRPFQIADRSSQGLAKTAALLFFLVLVAADFVVAYYALTDTMNHTMTNPSSVVKKEQIIYLPVVNQDGRTPPSGNAVERPTAEPTAQPTLRTASGKYVVESGDTLFTIASKYGLSVDDLLAANQIPDRDKIEVGQELVIPGVSATPKP